MSTGVEAPPNKTGAETPVGKRRYRLPRGILAITMLCTGAAGLIYEYSLSTMFSYQGSSSIEQFSITIGVMFAMMGVGGWFQRKLKGPLVEYFVLTELLLVLLGGFATIALQWAFVELQTEYAFIKIAYPGLIGLLIGIEIPLVTRINERFTKDLSQNIAGTWAWDYIGGAFGVVGWILLLRAYVPLTYISFLTAGCNLLVAIVSVVFFWRNDMLSWRFSRPLLPVVTLAVVILTLFGPSNVDAWGMTINQKLYEDPIVFQTTTKYQHIVMTKGPHPTDPQGASYQLYLNGNKQFNSVDEAIYHEFLVHPAVNLAASRKNVLVLGGGDGMAVRELLKYKDVEHITLVDLDAGMIDLAKNNPILRELNGNAFGDARVRSNLDHEDLNKGIVDTKQKQPVFVETNETEEVDCQETSQGTAVCKTDPLTQKVADVNIYTLDADKFISERSGPYDVVIVDLPDPNSVELAKLYSQEFYAKIKQNLSPDGMVVVQATSPYHAKETFLCILRTMAAAGLNVLPYHENVPSFGDWGWILGSPALKSDVLHERANNLEPFPVETREIQVINMKRALIFNRSQLRSQNSTISTLMQPTVFEYYAYEAWPVG